MNNIINYDFYTSEMGKVMWDKLFFVPHIDATYFVDYGCADGAMLEAMSSFVGGEFCGYDNDLQMIERAKSRNLPRTMFTNDWDKVKFDIAFVREYGGGKSCLILSSIIHEIYTYLDEAGVREFWHRVFNSGFDYIVVRDMALSSFEQSAANAEKIRGRADPEQLKDFEEIWGSIDEYENAMHFLLKYRYKDNWQREVQENYFPIEVESVRDMKSIRQNIFNYKEILFEHFSVPFIRKQIQNDFDMAVTQKTHYKLIWEKK